MPDETLPDTWTIRELPILREALARLDSGEGHPEMKEIGEARGIPPLQLTAGIEALANAEPHTSTSNLLAVGGRIATRADG